MNYEYNKDGIRISKEIGNNKTNYYLEGTQIIIEEKNNNMIYYMYDDSGSLIGFKYNNEVYYYQKNYQNDITGIYDSSYNLVVIYKYDGWGKVLSVVENTTNNIGSINPFRYRSYYYDEETSLYYLNSRYYNPEWCRFINADGIIGANQDILSLNLYAYVSNNPISNADDEGSYAWALPALSTTIGAGIAVFVGATVALLSIPIIKATYTTIVDSNININTTSQSKKENNSKKKKENKEKECYVYGLYNEQGVQYVGRTYDLKRRADQHEKNPYRANLQMIRLDTTYSYFDCRASEQINIERFKTLNRLNPMHNQRNGVALNSQFYKNYVMPMKTIYGETYVGR